MLHSRLSLPVKYGGLMVEKNLLKRFTALLLMYSIRNISSCFFFLLPDVIHTVGPIARGNLGQSQKDDLESCYTSSLKLMKDNNLRSVVS